MSLGRTNGGGCPDADGKHVTDLHAPVAARHRAPARRRAVVLGVGVAVSLVTGATMTAGTSPATAAATGAQVQGVIAASTAAAPAVVPTAAVPTTREQRLARLVNSERTTRGLKAYVVSASLSAIAEDQAHRMSRQQKLFHNPNLTTDVHNWRAVGENVAYTSTVWRAHTLLMNSPGHRANILSTTFSQVGLGVAKDSRGTVWVVQVFRKPS